MKVVLLISSFSLFGLIFCNAKNIDFSIGVDIDGKSFYPNLIDTTETGRKYYEYIVKYGEISEGEWFRPANLVSEPEHDIRCANWHEKHRPTDFEVDYHSFKNCLILKIDTNNLNANNPVLIYIPGYDLSSGDVRSTSGHYILDKNVVLVTVQYRVGVLGFLSTNTEEIPGNVGALDVILALKWIKNHISKFGGDPNRVTLFGQYKAAGLIGILTMSPLATDLYHQVIYQSGTPLQTNLTTTNPLEFARKIANEINCKNVEEIVALNKCILNAKYHELLEAYHKLMLKYDGEISPITIGGPSNLLPGDLEPGDRLNSETYKKVPTLGGVVDHPTIYLIDAYNENEYSRFSMKHFEEQFKDKVENTSTTEFKESSVKDDDSMTEELTKSMLDFAQALIKGLVTAFLPLEIDMGGMEIKTNLLRILTTNKEANIPAYLYAFKYQGSEHYFSNKEGSWLKNYVTLLDDNVFLFKPEKVISENDKRISKIMIDLWTSFAENGVPRSDAIKEWPQIVDTDGPYLVIAKNVTIGTDYSKELTPLVDCQSEKNCEWFEESASGNVIILE